MTLVFASRLADTVVLLFSDQLPRGRPCLPMFFSWSGLTVAEREQLRLMAGERSDPSLLCPGPHFPQEITLLLRRAGGCPYQILFLMLSHSAIFSKLHTPGRPTSKYFGMHLCKLHKTPPSHVVKVLPQLTNHYLAQSLSVQTDILP